MQYTSFPVWSYNGWFFSVGDRFLLVILEIWNWQFFLWLMSSGYHMRIPPPNSILVSLPFIIFHTQKSLRMWIEALPSIEVASCYLKKFFSFENILACRKNSKHLSLYLPILSDFNILIYLLQISFFFFFLPPGEKYFKWS